jgi:hypothetical protein
MKKSFFGKIALILVLFHVKSGKAQFFGLSQTSPQAHYWTALSYPPDGNYRVLNCIQQSTINIYFYKHAQILTYNSNFQLIDSVNLLNGVIPLRAEPLKKGNRLFWSAFFYDTLNPDPDVSQLVVLELDTNYKHIALHKINNLSYCSLINSNTLYFAGFFYVSQWDFYSNVSVIYKLNNQFIKLDSIVINAGLSEMRMIDNTFLLSVSNFTSSCSDPFGNRLEKLELDTGFNFINCYAFNGLGTFTVGSTPVTQNINIMRGNTGLLPISKTKIFALGRMFVGYFQSLPPVTRTAIVNCIIDNSNSIINTSVCNDSTMNLTYADGSNIVAIKQNEILTVGCAGYDYQTSPMTQSQNNKIWVIKLDTLGNLMWKKGYGGDRFYNPTGIIFTTDGGCLISGWRYAFIAHPIGTPPPVESFLLKLDANGNYSALGMIDYSTLLNPVKCYPVPATNTIYFDIPFAEDVSITLYNNLGQLVLKETNYENLKPINIALLRSDIYFYRVQTKTTMYSGKVIKE